MDNEAKNIYIITQGCYSDYHIVTVFDDEDKAKEKVTWNIGVRRT